jgi:tRNA (guanine-N7-)-methyltransferase
VLRQGRVSNAQRRAHSELLPIYGIAYRGTPLDLEELFGRSAPKVFEIGSGMGETTAAVAAANPHIDYLAAEVHTPGVGSLLKLIAERELRNIRVVQHDAVEVLKDMIAPGALSGVHIFFPDPWPKKRHHKRRLVQGAFVPLLASRLCPGGYVHVATDWEDYARKMLEALGSESALRNTEAEFSGRGVRPATRFEARGLALGHPVWDLVFRRV